MTIFSLWILISVACSVTFVISKIAKLGDKNSELLLLVRELREQLDIQRDHQSSMARRIIDLSQKHNQLATLFEEHGHGLLDEDTMQPMAHSTTPVSLVEILQRMMSQAKIDPGMSMD